MLILSEYSQNLPASASVADLRKMEQTAALLGGRIYSISQKKADLSYEDILWHIPKQTEKQLAIWVGYIPSPQDYFDCYQILLAKNIHLVNNPQEFRKAEEFDRYYPFIESLTARSIVVEDWETCLNAANEIGFPVFLKGTVQSYKADGWAACVANDIKELKTISHRIFGSKRRSLGKVIVRQCVDFRHSRKNGGGFPLGREYRVFLYRNKVLEYGYYWEGEDILAKLNTEEKAIILDLSEQAARQIGVPYIALDIGQRSDGHWIVIEAGDGQFSGISQINIIRLWQKLLAID